jgi:propanol-preferring alcohol dehydrogenase
MDCPLMLAVQLTAWGEYPQLADVPKPAPTGDQLLLEVGAVGLCRSDLHVMDAPADRFDYQLPLTLGHEVAGTVVSTGPAADASWVGRSVVVQGIWPCRRCRNCLRGRENYCLKLAPRADGKLAPIGNGLGHPGGLAEFMLVPSADVLVAIGSLGHADAAPLADAGLTAYHAIRTNADLVDERTVAVVVGIGGLGHLALQILRDMGVTQIVAVDTRFASLELARTLGALTAHPTLDDASAAITGLGGADIVFDFAGAPTTVEPATRLLAPGGRVVMVGSGGGRVTVGKDVGLVNGWQVRAPFWGTTTDLGAVVDLAARGRLHAETKTYPLHEAPDVYRLLRTGSIAGRAVIVPSAGPQGSLERETAQ